MNKKLSREEAIRLHREMWQDMQVELGDEPGALERYVFKKKWVEEHFPDEFVNSNCFLCEYAQKLARDSFTRCRYCPIAWNSNITPICNPGGIFGFCERNMVDYRYSPISVILALPEREVM